MNPSSRSPGLWSPLLYSFRHHHLHPQSWTGGHEVGAKYRQQGTKSRDSQSSEDTACIWWTKIIYVLQGHSTARYVEISSLTKNYPSWHRWVHRHKSLPRYASLDPEAPKHRSMQGKRPHLGTEGQPMGFDHRRYLPFLSAKRIHTNVQEEISQSISCKKAVAQCKTCLEDAFLGMNAFHYTHVWDAFPVNHRYRNQQYNHCNPHAYPFFLALWKPTANLPTPRWPSCRSMHRPQLKTRQISTAVSIHLQATLHEALKRCSLTGTKYKSWYSQHNTNVFPHEVRQAMMMIHRLDAGGCAWWRAKRPPQRSLRTWQIAPAIRCGEIIFPKQQQQDQCFP